MNKLFAKSTGKVDRIIRVVIGAVVGGFVFGLLGISASGLLCSIILTLSSYLARREGARGTWLMVN
jgi:uncharacterized membrane protein YeaQ/YmgE (transglycosylase-associated protein family)